VKHSLLFFGNKSWFTTILCVSISYVVSSCTRRSVSYSDKNSDIQTQTNVVFSYYRIRVRRQHSSDRRTGSLNCELTSVIIALIDSSFANMSSWVPLSPPIMDDIWMEENHWLEWRVKRADGDKLDWSWVQSASPGCSVSPKLSPRQRGTIGNGGCDQWVQYRIQ